MHEVRDCRPAIKCMFREICVCTFSWCSEMGNSPNTSFARTLPNLESTGLGMVQETAG